MAIWGQDPNGGRKPIKCETVPKRARQRARAMTVRREPTFLSKGTIKCGFTGPLLYIGLH
jgi:hypothetical protein